jgi:hypothetical protein
MMKLNGYEYEGTGGGCSALIKRVGNIEIVVTDGDLSAPDNFPVEVGVFNGDGSVIDNFINGAVVNSIDELKQFETRIIK